MKVRKRVRESGRERECVCRERNRKRELERERGGRPFFLFQMKVKFCCSILLICFWRKKPLNRILIYVFIVSSSLS